MVAVGSAASAATVSDGIGLTLSRNGDTLIISPDLNNPQDNRRVELSRSLNAIAYRPDNGVLYGYSTDTGLAYAVDTSTGALQQTGAPSSGGTNDGPAVQTTPEPGFDFNNSVDAARIVGETGENLVFFPRDFTDERAGQILRFTDPFFVDGDELSGDPAIVANAYTNAVPIDERGVIPTEQFVLLDSGTGFLGTLANNAGDVDTLGALLFPDDLSNINQATGFDILSNAVGDNLAFVQARGSDGDSAVFSFDIETLLDDDGLLQDGVSFGDVPLTLLGFYGEDTRSFAVAPQGNLNNPAPIPLPAGGLLLLGGLAGLGLLRRRTA